MFPMFSKQLRRPAGAHRFGAALERTVSQPIGICLPNFLHYLVCIASAARARWSLDGDKKPTAAKRQAAEDLTDDSSPRVRVRAGSVECTSPHPKTRYGIFLPRPTQARGIPFRLPEYRDSP
jgi:hypothetical protein